jgi:cyclic peptide transporter
MLNFIRDIAANLDRNDRRTSILLLAACWLDGLSRSLFLVTVNESVQAVAEKRFTFIYIVLVLVLFFLILGVSMFRTINGQMIAARVVLRLRAQFAREIGRTNLRFIEKETIGGLHFHLTATIGNVARLYTLLITMLVAAGMLIFNSIYMIWLSPIGFLITFVVGSAGVGVYRILESADIAQRQKLESLRWQTHSMHFNLLNGFKELRLSEEKSEDFYRLIGALDRQVHDSQLHLAKIEAAGTTATTFFEFLAVAVIGIGFSVFAGVSSLTAMQLITAILFTMAPLSELVGSFPGLNASRVAQRNLKRIMQTIEEIKEPVQRSSELPKFESLSLKDVMFRFNDASADTDEFVLGPIDLTIRRGDVVYFVGENGSGKTVLMRVIAGLYPATSGKLLFNEKTIAQWNMQEYRDHFTTVFNDFYLFKELLGQHDVSVDEVTRLLDYFGIKGKTHFSDGSFSTIDLSSGQKKRLALVVALLDERPILIIDEFGTEQDPGHRDQFYREWLPEMKRMGMTLLIVSHDDEYYECADMIVRMDFGKIVECRRLQHPENQQWHKSAVIVTR